MSGRVGIWVSYLPQHPPSPSPPAFARPGQGLKAEAERRRRHRLCRVMAYPGLFVVGNAIPVMVRIGRGTLFDLACR